MNFLVDVVYVKLPAIGMHRMNFCPKDIYNELYSLVEGECYSFGGSGCGGLGSVIVF